MAIIEQKSEKTLNAAQNANIHVVGRSIIGTRSYQQDAYYTCYNGDTCLAVICDGMGGVEHGDVASRLSVEMFARDYEKMKPEDDPYQFLREEALRIDKMVSTLTDDEGKRLDTGTTLIATIVKNQNIWWISIGDSRIYVNRKEQFTAVTREHNYRFQLECQLLNNEITEEEYRQEISQGEALISYIGMNGIELIDQNVKPFVMQYMDRFLLCSDGLVKALGEDKIKDIMTRYPLDIEDTLNELINSTKNCEKKHIDNTTVVLISYE